MNIPPYSPEFPWWAYLVVVLVGLALMSPVVAGVVTRSLAGKIDESTKAAKRAAEAASVAEAEVLRNSGSSMRDSIDRQERAQDALLQEVGRQGVELANLQRDLGGLRSEMRQERTERADHQRDVASRLTAVERDLDGRRLP